MKKKILFAVTSNDKLGDTGKSTGYYLSEVTHPWDVLAQEYEIDVVSPKGGKAPADGVDLTDPVNKKYWENPDWQAKMNATLSPEEVRPEDYVAIFYAGGQGVMWDFPNNKELAKIAAKIWRQGGAVSAVCHGPAGLINIMLDNGEPLIKGKRLDSFTNAEEKEVGTENVVPFLLEDALKAQGCIYDCDKPWSDHVVVDGRLVTGQNPMSAKDVGKALSEVLKNL